MRSLNIVATLDHQKTIAKILDTAERLFRHYGCGKTAVADIARELEMSAANIYRFFASKAEIQQAICNRRLDDTRVQALGTAKLRINAIESDWSVVEQHVSHMNEVVASIIADGIETGEFRKQDPAAASRCFNAAIVSLYHPKVVSNCIIKQTHAQPDELIEFAIQALAR